MKILKPGKNYKMVFTCRACECQFETDIENKEFTIDEFIETSDNVTVGGSLDRYKTVKTQYLDCHAPCPNCGYTVHKKHKL